MNGTLLGCVDPKPSNLGTQAYSVSRDQTPSRVRDVGGNKDGIPFLSSSFLAPSADGMLKYSRFPSLCLSS